MTTKRFNFLLRNTIAHVPYYLICIWEFIELWLKGKSNYQDYKSIQLIKRLPKDIALWFHTDNNKEWVHYAGDNIFKIFNNKWGINKLRNPGKPDKSYQYTQRIGGQVWEVIAPVGNWGVLGYPEIGLKNIPLNYFLGGKLGKIILKYEINLWLARKKKFNLAFDFWLLNNTNWGWNRVKQEIMIWEDRNIALPYGKYMGDFTYYGYTYHIYHGYKDRTNENLMGDGSEVGWYITSFVRSKAPKSQVKQNYRHGIIELNLFLNHLKDKNLIVDTATWLHNIELGTEVYNTSLIAEINNFEVITE